MAGHSQHTGCLGLSELSTEIRQMIVDQTILSDPTHGQKAAGLAAVHPLWQTLVEPATFHSIIITLQANDSNGADHFFTVMTPTRVGYLRKLTIKIEWPFFRSAQATRGFSGAQAGGRLKVTVDRLTRFLTSLNAMATGSNAQNLTIVLKPVKPDIVPASYPLSFRGNWRRDNKEPEINSMWSDTELLKLSKLQRKWLPLELSSLLNQMCPTLSMVTSLDFPPDFFPPIATSSLLRKFPNLTEISLNHLSKMSFSETWHTGPFAVDLPFYTPHISKLTLGRGFPYDSLSNDVARWSRYNGGWQATGLSGYIDAIRNYTGRLEFLKFEHFAAPFNFYIRFFDTTHLLDQTFQWAKLREVHIDLYGDDIFHNKMIPMATDNGRHLSLHAAYAVTSLFRYAGAAASKMPHLKKMRIHIPRLRDFFLMAVTLKFVVASRRDASLTGIWGSPSRLDIWAAPRNVAVGAAWWTSICQVRGMQLRHEWHDCECPEPY